MRVQIQLDRHSEEKQLMSVSSPSPAPYRAPAFIDFKPEWSGKGATEARLEALRELSVVIIDDFVDSEWIPALREAGRRVKIGRAHV